MVFRRFPILERFSNQSECVVLTEDDYTQLMWVTAGEVPGKCCGILYCESIKTSTIFLRAVSDFSCWFYCQGMWRVRYS